ncbi:MAG TPA: FecR domain-containing protein [Sphingomicrobium sp.]|nr:FecR domain-containing protein [Sphingomicrobium sp.]
MKRTYLMLLLLVISTPCVSAAPIAQVQKSSGAVWIYSRTEVSRPAGAGAPVESGVSIATGAGSNAVLRFKDGQLIALGSSTTFRVKDYAFDAADPSKHRAVFELVQGSLRAVTGRIGQANPGGWRLLTPDATIAINGTDFVAVMERGLYLRVNTGVVTLANAAGTARFTMGTSAFVQAGNSAPATALVTPDGLFAELDAIGLNASAGSSSADAAGAAQTANVGIGGAGVLTGVIAAAIAVAAHGGGSTTTHH